MHSWPHWWQHPMHSTSCDSVFAANAFLASVCQTIIWEVMASEGWQGDSASQQDECSKLPNLWMNLAILQWLVLPNWQDTTFPNMVSVAVKMKCGAICAIKVVDHSTQHVWVVQVICNTPQHTELILSTATALCATCRSGQPPAELPPAQVSLSGAPLPHLRQKKRYYHIRHPGDDHSPIVSPHTKERTPLLLPKIHIK